MVHRSHRLDLPGGTAAQLQACLSEPARPLNALLNRKKVQQAEGGLIHYVSRPCSLQMFRIQPEVIFVPVGLIPVCKLNLLFLLKRYWTRILHA